MKGLYVNWRSQRNNAFPQSEFEDFNLLTMIYSTLKFRSYGNTTKFYADEYTIKELEHLQLLDAWDQYDYSALGKEIHRLNIDPSTFFSIGKFITLQLEDSPSMLIDIDLVLWQDPKYLTDNKKAVFTHWESVMPSTKWYCKKSELLLPDGFRLKSSWDFRLRAANTSVLYFSDNALKQYYVDQALRLMKNNPAINYPNRLCAELYFAEQRLLPICAKELGMLGDIAPLVDTVWSPVKGIFIRQDKTLGNWEFFYPDASRRVTHTWISKGHIAENKGYRYFYCCKMIDELLRMAPSYGKTLVQIDYLKKYFDMLERYGGIEELIKKKLVDENLY